jgi:hypothetical protein
MQAGIDWRRNPADRPASREVTGKDVDRCCAPGAAAGKPIGNKQDAFTFISVSIHVVMHRLLTRRRRLAWQGSGSANPSPGCAVPNPRHSLITVDEKFKWIQNIDPHIRTAAMQNHLAACAVS